MDGKRKFLSIQSSFDKGGYMHLFAIADDGTAWSALALGKTPNAIQWTQVSPLPDVNMTTAAVDNVSILSRHFAKAS
ncbi:hypothetical protein [Comamonas sp. GB3 AK4-5]|uniref:hypothetical protein n=1 Tax=Comamonas sp. GB3 AK4-5 TaxID=3231487 RepID=UPI00351E0EA2